jgi:hypothetical protein
MAGLGYPGETTSAPPGFTTDVVPAIAAFTGLLPTCSG